MRKPTTAGADTFDQADFVIVTALEKEAQAVVRRLEDCRTKRFEERDIRTYHSGWFPSRRTTAPIAWSSSRCPAWARLRQLTR